MNAIDVLPPDITQSTLAQLITDLANRTTILSAVVARFQERHGASLEEFESRLAQGEGREHPDWEDSIEWRNAVETLQRERALRRVLEWLMHSTTPLPVS